MLGDAEEVTHTGVACGLHPLVDALIQIGRRRVLFGRHGAISPLLIDEGVDAIVAEHTVRALDLLALGSGRLFGRHGFRGDGHQWRSERNDEGKAEFGYTKHEWSELKRPNLHPTFG